MSPDSVSTTRSRRLPLPSPDIVPRTRPPSSLGRRSLSFRRLSLLLLEDPPSLFRLPLFGAGLDRGDSAGGVDGDSERGDSAGGLGGGSFRGLSAGGLG